MSRLPANYNWGSEVRNVNQELYNQLSEVYKKTAGSVNIRSRKHSTVTDPPASGQINTDFDIGDIWVRTDTNQAWILTSRTTAEAVTWTLIT